MSAWPRDACGGDQERHVAAVARTLGWAEEAAARDDYVDAIGWVQVIEAIGDELTQGYKTKRQEWCTALAESRVRKENQDARLGIGREP